MAQSATPHPDVPGASETLLHPDDAALQQFTWRSGRHLSRLGRALGDNLEHFLYAAGFDRAPWLAVGMVLGISAWFALPNRWQWLALIALCLAMALAAWGFMSVLGRWPHLRAAIIGMALALAGGCGLVWVKSALVGTPPLSYPSVAPLIGTVLERIEQPAEGRIRLQLAVRDPHTGQPIRVSISVPMDAGASASGDRPDLAEGAVVRLRARLMPPEPPRLPGARNAAREAWFAGLTASGGAIGPVEVMTPPRGVRFWAWARHALSAHVRSAVPGSAGGIAATLVSGNRGGIAQVDQQAMRDAGLTHLLAISGLHVSAVVAGAYFLAFRLLALWPWFALRRRVPVMATLAGAGAGAAYTLLTGMHLPTVRACVGALLVLGAMLAGRSPLSMRLLAVAAVAVMLLWPEEVIGPSFQMSFGSVIAIIALHSTAPVHAFLAPRAERLWRRVGRHMAVLLLSGMVIDLALMPVALFHFHRAGAYGSVATLIAIPLVTFVAMPAIAAGLVLDLAGLGAPAWWVAGHALDGLLTGTHWLTSQPGAVSRLPAMGGTSYVLVVGGMLWLGLWHGRARLWGLVPALVATVSLVTLRPPDMLIAADGHNLGIIDGSAGGGGELLLLRMGRSTYNRDMFREMTGFSGEAAPLDGWPGARCNHDFCAVELARGGRIWRVLVVRTLAVAPYAAMARACAGADIVVSPRVLYGPCQPALLKADKALLARTGGLALDLAGRRVVAVADGEGDHPWWRAARHLSAQADEDDQSGGQGIAPEATSGPLLPGPGADGATAGPLIAPLR